MVREVDRLVFVVAEVLRSNLHGTDIPFLPFGSRSLRKKEEFGAHSAAYERIQRPTAPTAGGKFRREHEVPLGIESHERKRAAIHQS